MAQQLFLIGHPVGHSKSPAMHNVAYDALSLDWAYGLANCPTEADARVFLARNDWLACNVTMPYKALAYEVAEARSMWAELSGSANVLVRCNEGLWADNTDGRGCTSYLARCGVDLAGAKVVVCGTGATARSIMHACVVAGASSVSLVGRDATRAQQVVGAYGERLHAMLESAAAEASNGVPDWLAAPHARVGSTHLDGFAYGSASAMIAQADVVIDATPLGMSAGDPAPFDSTLLSCGQVVLDVVYGQGESALLAAARERGCAVFDGAGMLVAQAVETVRDVVGLAGVADDVPPVDLFDVMARAAGFDLP